MNDVMIFRWKNFETLFTILFLGEMLLIQNILMILRLGSILVTIFSILTTKTLHNLHSVYSRGGD